jgi:ABC-type multidrug transport system fused ATPase/permease subunit
VCSGTVADNLRLGDPVADVVEMRRALDAAGLGLALDRTVGDGGDELSAGERRRLAMARALLRRADLVVLDEATAGLDAVSEASIVRAARAEADRGAAVLMVAHRPAALAGADRVVVLG